MCGLISLCCCYHHLSQRAKEDVLQKEVKVKILKDSIHLLVSRISPPAGSSAQDLTSELQGVLANYHKLCDRFKSKCHTLEVTGPFVLLKDVNIFDLKYKLTVLASVKMKCLIIVDFSRL